jgi:NAD(P)-dependent dehydrogenase (short-subunit alcohol dehydrogenase family)
MSQPTRHSPHLTERLAFPTHQRPGVDHEASVSIARIGLSMTIFANRIDSVGDSRSKYHHAFHHDGITMMASPRSTARMARLANFLGVIGRPRSGLVATASQASYSATKHAIVAISKTLRLEAERHGVQVSVLCPGAVRTPAITGGKYGRTHRYRDEGLRDMATSELFLAGWPLAQLPQVVHCNNGCVRVSRSPAPPRRPNG